MQPAPWRRVESKRSSRINSRRLWARQSRRIARSVQKDIHVADDDIVDAFAALWTAERILRGDACTLPAAPPRERSALRGAGLSLAGTIGPFLQEMRRQEQDPQQRHVDQGHGGGIATAHRDARAGDMAILSGKFLISPADLERLRAICEYWEDKCLMAVGDRLPLGPPLTDGLLLRVT